MNIEFDVMERLKLLAKNKGITQTEIINNALKQGLLIKEQEEKQSKIKGDSFLKLGGIVTASESFSATEEVKRFRNGEL